MKRQPHRRKHTLKTGDFIFLKGRYVTSKWSVVARNEDGSCVLHQTGLVKKEYIHPVDWFLPGRSLWKGGLPAFPYNAILDRDFEAFKMKTEAGTLMKALVRTQKRLAKIQSSDKIVNCTLTLRKAVEDLKAHMKRKNRFGKKEKDGNDVEK